MEIKEEKEGDCIPDDNHDDVDDGWKEMGCCSKIKFVFRNITVEPLLAFFQVSSVMSSLTTQNLNLQKACRVNLQMNDDICYGLENKNMTFYANEEVQVQQLVSDMLIWQTIIQSSIPCILVIFIGSWSDRYRKRKPFMLIPVFGELLRNIGLLLCVFYFNELKMEIAGLVESIPTSVAGGLTVLYMSAFSYIGDISSMKNRTLRVGLMNLFFGSAWPIGAALSGVLFQKLGFYGVYYISTTLYLIAFIYGFVRINEHPQHIKEAFHVTFRKGPRQRWIQLMMLMLTIIVVQGPLEGEVSVGYLYTRVRFNWNEMDYSKFSTFLFMVNIMGVIFAIGVLSHMYQVDDALIGVIACLSKVLAGLIYAFAPTENFLYIGAVVDLMSGSSYIVVKSILSKIVPRAELGQVLSIVAVVDTMVPVVYKPMYSLIYRVTVDKFPGAFYVIGSIMLIPSIFLYWWMYRINKQGLKEKCIAGEDKENR